MMKMMMSWEKSDEFRKCCKQIGLKFGTTALIIVSRDVLLCLSNYRGVMYLFNVTYMPIYRKTKNIADLIGSVLSRLD